MLLPALSKARQKARAITCVNRLKQQGLAFLMYGNDYEDWFPCGKSSENYGWHGGNRWDQQIMTSRYKCYGSSYTFYGGVNYYLKKATDLVQTHTLFYCPESASLMTGLNTKMGQYDTWWSDTDTETGFLHASYNYNLYEEFNPADNFAAWRFTDKRRAMAADFMRCIPPHGDRFNVTFSDGSTLSLKPITRYGSESRLCGWDASHYAAAFLNFAKQ